jgi:AcrR family transcriptional regulator
VVMRQRKPKKSPEATPEATPRATSRVSPKSVSKDILFQGALRIVNQYGYGALTLSLLGEKTKMTRQLVYYHFKDTDDILLWIAQEWSQTGQQKTIEAIANTNYIGPLRILAIADGLFDWMEAYPELSRAGLVLYQSSPYVPKLKEFMKIRRGEGLTRIHQMLSLECQDRTDASGLRELSLNLHAALYGYYLYVNASMESSSLSSARTQCKANLEMQLHAFLKFHQSR